MQFQSLRIEKYIHSDLSKLASCWSDVFIMQHVKGDFSRRLENLQNACPWRYLWSSGLWYYIILLYFMVALC